jgi:hypothetical protein
MEATLMRRALAGLAVTVLGLACTVVGPVSVRATETCPQGDICTFSGPHETGKMQVYDDTWWGCHALRFASAVNESVRNKEISLHTDTQCHSTGNNERQLVVGDHAEFSGESIYIPA